MLYNVSDFVSLAKNSGDFSQEAIDKMLSDSDIINPSNSLIIKENKSDNLEVRLNNLILRKT